jgi:PilZ domain-containing protein
MGRLVLLSVLQHAHGRRTTSAEALGQDGNMQGTGTVATFPTAAMKNDGERARRFPLGLSLRYRSLGEREWHEGLTENISRSGVLIRTTHILELDTAVEMTFTLPAGRVAPEIRCEGRIVRTVLPGRLQAPPGMAATISDYRFVRDESAR